MTDHLTGRSGAGLKDVRIFLFFSVSPCMSSYFIEVERDRELRAYMVRAVICSILLTLGKSAVWNSSWSWKLPGEES